MYNEAELAKASGLCKKRRLIAIVPAVLVLAAALGIFIWGQLLHSQHIWKITSALTVLGTFYLVFMLGVYVRPVSCYAKNMDAMLHGKQHTITGIYKAFGSEVCQREGINCYPLMINIGQKDDGMDDRLFYFDALKPAPAISIGESIRLQYHGNMVSAYEKAE